MIEPLFILGPARSFTSVSCAMIGRHPQMFGLAETNLFIAHTVGELRTLHRTAPLIEHGLVRSLSELAFETQTEDTIEVTRGWLAENEHMTTVELFRTMQAWIAPRTLIDKSPRHVLRPQALARIARNFPKARYLHLTRHPSGTLESALKAASNIKIPRGLLLRPDAAFSKPSIDLDSPEIVWLRPHVNILELLKDIPAERQMRIRGEDLLSDPARHLAVIAEWLGIPTDADAISAMMRPELSPFAQLGPINARYGHDLNFMRDPRLRPYVFEPRAFNYRLQDGTTVEFSETIQSHAKAFGY